MASDALAATPPSRSSLVIKEDPLQKKSYDLGILFVHGIRTQKKGETLLAFGEPIATWLNRWLSGSNSEEQESTVDYGAASLTGDEPARAELTLKLAQPEASRSQWLLAECWWAEEIQEPRFGDLVVWAGQIAPATVLLHFFERARRAYYKITAKGSKIDRLSGIFSLLSVFLNFFVVVLSLPLLVGLLAACLVFA
jgi:hypothetical protein